LAAGRCLGPWAIAGCGLGGPGDGKESAPGVDPRDSLVRQIRLGLFTIAGESYGEAHSLVVNECMEEAGFPGDWREAGTITTVMGSGEDARAAALDPWFGVSNAEMGAKFGYHEVVEETTTREGRKVTDAYWTALGGPPGEGCMGKGEAAMAEGGMTAEEQGAIAVEINRTVEERVRADAEGVIAKASAEWSQCMNDEGYQYPDPHASFDDFAPTLVEADGAAIHQYASMAPSEEERRVAEVDGGCKEKVNFWEAVDEVTFAVETAVEVEMRDSINKLVEEAQRQADTAAAIIASYKQ
jgi:hypothetical protein